MPALPLISIGAIFASDGSPSEVSTQISNPRGGRKRKTAKSLIVPEQVLALVPSYSQAWERYDRIRKRRS